MKGSHLSKGLQGPCCVLPYWKKEGLKRNNAMEPITTRIPSQLQCSALSKGLKAGFEPLTFSPSIWQWATKIGNLIIIRIRESKTKWVKLDQYKCQLKTARCLSEYFLPVYCFFWRRLWAKTGSNRVAIFSVSTTNKSEVTKIAKNTILKDSSYQEIWLGCCFFAVRKVVWSGGCQHNTMGSTLASQPSWPGFNSQHSQKISRGKIIDVAEVNQRRC